MRPNGRYAAELPHAGLSALRRFVAKQPEVERCELCAVGLRDRHQHLVDPQARRLICACDACAILFGSGGETKYRRVPSEVFWLREMALSDQVWNSLGIPIGLAFLYRSSVSGEVLAVYPSPAGPTETTVEDESWQDIVRQNVELASLADDVEALLVNRMNGARDYFRVAIDECYKLTGIIRKHWRGFSGGEEGWEQVKRFFDELQDRACPETVTDARSIV